MFFLEIKTEVFQVPTRLTTNHLEKTTTRFFLQWTIGNLQKVVELLYIVYRTNVLLFSVYIVHVLRHTFCIFILRNPGPVTCRSITTPHASIYIRCTSCNWLGSWLLLNKRKSICLRASTEMTVNQPFR